MALTELKEIDRNDITYPAYAALALPQALELLEVMAGALDSNDTDHRIAALIAYEQFKTNVGAANDTE